MSVDGIEKRKGPESPTESTQNQLGALSGFVEGVKKAIGGTGESSEILKGMMDNLGAITSYFKGFLETILGEDWFKKKEEKEKDEKSEPSKEEPQRTPPPAQVQSFSTQNTIAPQEPHAPLDITLENGRIQGDFSHVLCLGSSSLNAMAQLCNAVNLSKNGASSNSILNKIKKTPDSLKGVDTLIVQMGLNDIGFENYNPENVIGNLQEVIALFSAYPQEKEVPKKEKTLFIATGLPFNKKLRSLSGGKYLKRVNNGLNLRNELREQFDSMEQEGVKIHFIDYYDLYAYKQSDAIPAGYEVGDLKVEYEGKNQKDLMSLIHPPALLAQQAMAHLLSMT